MSEAQRKSHQAATAHIPPFGLRMQSVLKAELEQAATEAGRSLNAEIVDRLRQSFEPMVELDPDVMAVLEWYSKKQGVDTREALSILILAGAREADKKIVYLQMRPGVTMNEFADQVKSIAKDEPDAVLHYASRSGKDVHAVGAEIQSVTGGTVRVSQRISIGS